ncbi:hypothetical protein ACHAXN_013149 [Cyclotella atomus]
MVTTCRGQKETIERNPLLEVAQRSNKPKTQYDAAASRSGASERGKLRFAVRQQILEQRRQKQHAGTYKSIFGSKPKAAAKKVETKPEHSHSAVYDYLNPKSHASSARCFQKFITLVILVDVVFYIVSTEPKFEGSSLFYYAECITSSIFMVEYISRLVVCTEQRKYGKRGPIRGRLRYLCTASAMLDSFATLPFFIELCTGYQMPTLTYLRIFRLLRITRTSSYSKAMDAVVRVFYFNQEIMIVAGLLGLYLVLFTSIAMYHLRPRGDDVKMVEDAADFESIGSTMVLSLLMLTGQGGPSGELPWYTQIVVLMTGMFSVAMFAIPASMLTWGFEAEAQRLGVKARKKMMARQRGEEYNDYTSSSSSDNDSVEGYGDISTSDEEYMNIIGGEESEEDGDGVDNSLLKSLEVGMTTLEASMVDTNKKLDLILQKMK